MTISENERKKDRETILKAKRTRICVNFYLTDSDQDLSLLDKMETLRHRDRWSMTRLLREAVAEYVGRHFPGNPGPPLNHWTKGEPLSVAAEEKLSQKDHERPTVDYGSMSLDELRTLAKKRFLSDRERSFINFFIRQKEALR